MLHFIFDEILENIGYSWPFFCKCLRYFKISAPNYMILLSIHTTHIMTDIMILCLIAIFHLFPTISFGLELLQIIHAIPTATASLSSSVAYSCFPTYCSYAAATSFLPALPDPVSSFFTVVGAISSNCVLRMRQAARSAIPTTLKRA